MFIRSLILALAFAAPVHAAPVMDLDADNLLRAAPYLKEQLALTPNQQTLWQQVSAKSGTILRTRQSRRERLQADLKTRLSTPAQELRELNVGLEQETTLSANENHELRELWLSVADALDDKQRAEAARFLVSQLERVDQPERGERPAQRPGGERRGPKGGGEGRPPRM